MAKKKKDAELTPQEETVETPVEETVEEVAERIRSEIRQKRLAEFKPGPYSDFLEFYRTDPLTALRGIDWKQENGETEA